MSMRYYLTVAFVLTLFLVPWFSVYYPNETYSFITSIGRAGDELAAVVFTHAPVSVSKLHMDYEIASQVVQPVPARKVRILIVPGHEPGFGGAEFGSLKERDMTVELARDLQGFLAGNNRFQVFVSRDVTDWSPIFATYFKDNWNDIVAWQQAHKQEMANLTRVGGYKPATGGVIHNDAPTDVALRIYGIDKWANENKVDIVIHVHFNDYPGHGQKAGDYSGFTIYVPQNQYANSATTHALADSIFKRLSKYTAVSNLPGESAGIVEDQDLIAIGAYNSVDAASMLVEYGYIYEPQFVNPVTRGPALRDLAFQTYVGLQDFFDPKNVVAANSAFDTLLMPHEWKAPFTATNASASDVLALQTALLLDGEYPPAERTKNDCPRSGTLGPCTKQALSAFQSKHGIHGETDRVGPQTIGVLRQIYSIKVN